MPLIARRLCNIPVIRLARQIITGRISANDTRRARWSCRKLQKFFGPKVPTNSRSTTWIFELRSARSFVWHSLIFIFRSRDLTKIASMLSLKKKKNLRSYLNESSVRYAESGLSQRRPPIYKVLSLRGGLSATERAFGPTPSEFPGSAAVALRSPNPPRFSLLTISLPFFSSSPSSSSCVPPALRSLLLLALPLLPPVSRRFPLPPTTKTIPSPSRLYRRPIALSDTYLHSLCIR